MIAVKLRPLVGDFAENKDKAREIRLHTLLPALKDNQEITLDFEGVESATQSFIHALISDLIRTFGARALDHLYFKNCNETIQKLINIVVEYMLESE